MAAEDGTATSGLLYRLSVMWALAGGACLAVIVVATMTNVSAFTLDRLAEVLGLDGPAGLPGYEDAVRLLVGVAALMVLPYCQARRGHVAADVLTGGLPPAMRRRLDRVWLGATAVVVAALAVWLGVGLVETRADGALTPVLGWPVWPFMLPGVLSLGLWALVAADQMRTGGGAA